MKKLFKTPESELSEVQFLFKCALMGTAMAFIVIPAWYLFLDLIKFLFY